MRVLLVRPISPNERFGLGPFFRVEPLGLEYIASALIQHGHHVEIVDLRFSPSLRRVLRRFRPELVGVACQHTVDIDAAIDTVRKIKQQAPSIFTLIGGHQAAAYPEAVFDDCVDAISVDDGEGVVPLLVEMLERGGDLSEAPGIWIRRAPGNGSAAFTRTARMERQASLDDVPYPARNLVSSVQKNYLVVHKTPLWAVETARGCPYRCSFCSIWQLHERSFRMRSIDTVCRDIATAGPNLFIVDDLFFHPASRSRELARELVKRGIKKDFILVQSRLDTVARAGEALEAWRPVASIFDIFFGFEAARDDQLGKLYKDMGVDSIEQGVRAARDFSYGVTGNFVIDPEWDEADFEAMWQMVDRLDLSRCGYTILTPLPGTPLFEESKARLVERDWSRYDMHHILFEPKLGRRRFFELFVQSWKRSVFSPRYGAKWWGWLRSLTPSQMVTLARVLYRSQRNMKVDAYLEESFPLQVPASIG